MTRTLRFRPLAMTMQNDLIVTKDRATALSLNAIVSDSLIVMLDLALGRAADASLPLAFGMGCAACLTAAVLFSLRCRRRGPVRKTP